MTAADSPGLRTGAPSPESKPRDRSPRPPAILWAPALVVAAAMALPLAYLIIRTLGVGSELGDLLFRVRTLQIILRSALLVAAVTAASAIISTPLAWLTVRTDLPLGRLWTILTSLPLVIPSYIGAFLVVAALGPKGMLQGGLETIFGINRLPDIYGFPGAMLTLTLLSYPYILLPLRAALTRMDPSLEEASRSLGDTPWTTFRRVTLPLLRPAMAAGGLLVALYTLSDFGAVSLLRYETFTWAIYLQYESTFDRALASGLSLVLVLFAVGILLGESYTRGRSRYHRTSSGAARPPALIKLGRWKWPALALCGSVVTFSLALPMALLTYQVARGVAAGDTISHLWSATSSSLYVSGLASGAALVAALPVAVLAVRFPGWASSLLERVSYMGFALPGLVIALALVFFGSQVATPIYQTTGLLVFAYVVLFLPAAVGSMRASLLQMSSRLEEAARSLGKTPLQTLYSITLPLLRSGLVAGATLVFLLTMKELPATLILSPIGFRTLSTSIWSAASEAFFAQAAAHALVLILVSSVPMTFLMLRERRQER